jgi:hypothetical protein
MTAVARTAAMLLALCLGANAATFAQGPGVHYLHHGNLPPGAIGTGHLLRGGPIVGYYQPVELRAPAGALVALVVADQFTEAQPAPKRAGLLVGQVYRMRVTNLPLNPGAEVFPTIEVIDRLYPPAGQERRFPIVVDLTREDLELALAGKFVTRIVYLEDPLAALPVNLANQPQNWFEIPAGRDPLAEADVLGRPVAILRMGARLPIDPSAPDPQFFLGSPPWVDFPVEMKVLPPPPGRAARRAAVDPNALAQ